MSCNSEARLSRGLISSTLDVLLSIELSAVVLPVDLDTVRPASNECMLSIMQPRPWIHSIVDACVDLQARSLRRAPGVADVVSSHACVCLGRPLWVVAASPPGYPSTPPPFPRRLVLGNALLRLGGRSHSFVAFIAR